MRCHAAAIAAADDGARRTVRRDRVVLRALDDLARRRRPAMRRPTLFAVDHHRGSEENQSGWDHHDHELVDDRVGLMDTLPFFRSAIHAAGLESVVVAVVGRVAGRRRPLVDAVGVPVHRRRARRATSARRLRRVDAARRGRRHAGDPRRLPRSGGWWPATVRGDLPAGDRRAAVSSWPPSPARCARCGAWAEPRSGGVTRPAQPASRRALRRSLCGCVRAAQARRASSSQSSRSARAHAPRRCCIRTASRA